MQDTDIVTMERYSNSYVVYRMVLFSVTLRDPNYPKPPHI